MLGAFLALTLLGAADARPLPRFENADFQGDTYEVESGTVAAGWTSFVTDPGESPPLFYFWTESDGRRKQLILRGDARAAGLYQTLTFQRNEKILFSVDGWFLYRIAVDPHGGTDPFAKGVVLSEQGPSAALTVTVPPGRATFFVFACPPEGEDGSEVSQAPLAIASAGIRESRDPSVGEILTRPLFPGSDVSPLTELPADLADLASRGDDEISRFIRKLRVYSRARAKRFDFMTWADDGEPARETPNVDGFAADLISLVSGGMAIRETVRLETLAPDVTRRRRGRDFERGNREVRHAGGRLFFLDDDLALLVDARYVGHLPFRLHTAGEPWHDATVDGEVAAASAYLEKNTDIPRMLVRCPDFALIVTSPDARDRGRGSEKELRSRNWHNTRWGDGSWDRPKEAFLSEVDSKYRDADADPVAEDAPVPVSAPASRPTPAPGTESSPGTAAVALEPVSIRSRDYAAMIGSREVAIPAALRAVPADMVAAWFASGRRALEIADDVVAWGGDLLALFRPDSDAGAVRSRIETQLCLRADAAAAAFLDLAVGSTTIAATDLALADGAGVAVIFEVKDVPLFEATLDRYRGEFIAKFPGAKRTEEEIAGVRCVIVESPARELSAVCGPLQDGVHRVVATSRATFRRVLETARAKAGPSLATAPDVRYLLSMAPVAQDAFLVLSDAAIRAMVSPSFRIAATRRLRCFEVAGDLAIARAVHEGVSRRAGVASSTDEIPVDSLLRDGLISEPPECPDGGTLRFDSMIAAIRCSVHDRVGFGVPIPELPSPRATPAECARFERFRSDYHDSFRKYIHPILIGRAPAGKGFSLRTTLLPLPERSLYDDLRGWAGGAPSTGTLETKLPSDAIAFLGGNLAPFGGYEPEFKHLEIRSGTDEVRLRLLGELKKYHSMFVRDLNWRAKEDVFGWVAPRALLFFRGLEANQIDAFFFPDVALAVVARDAARVRTFFSSMVAMIGRAVEKEEPGRGRSHTAVGPESVGAGQTYEFLFDLFEQNVRPSVIPLFTTAIGWDPDAFVLSTSRALARDLLDVRKGEPFGARYAEARRLAGVTGPSNVNFAVDLAAIRRTTPLLWKRIAKIDVEICEKRRNLARLRRWLAAEPVSPLAQGVACPRGGRISVSKTGVLSCDLHTERPGQWLWGARDTDAADGPLAKDALAHLDEMLRGVDFLEGTLTFTPQGLETRLFFGR